ncbi:Os01g0904100 [Oryza sativa Japonica Group]|uniref:Os01g0904100 protein n=1 Tax=Oryza sativa subsp. japonica TaxID=39947 RepID=A0A0P0VBY6_ORYSJ|nr:Os01g0904100 [Oryza sativa Japonica Group]
MQAPKVQSTTAGAAPVARAPATPCVQVGAGKIPFAFCGILPRPCMHRLRSGARSSATAGVIGHPHFPSTPVTPQAHKFRLAAATAVY